MCKTKADENSLSLQVAIMQKNTKNNMVMRNANMEEYQNNMVSQISGKILCMCKQLKPGILSAVALLPFAVNAR